MQQMDAAVAAGGLKSAKSMRALGYDLPASSHRRWTASRKLKKQSKRPGRKSKVDCPANIAAVRKVLDRASNAASLTCVVKEKLEDGTVGRVRKQRRTLVAQLSTIYRASPEVHKRMAETQFRRLVVKHCREYRKGSRKTDLCDHCLAYRKKILPQVAKFITHCQNNMLKVCSGYWAPFWRKQRVQQTMASGDAESKLKALQTYLSTTHEKEHASDRAKAAEPWRIRHVEGELLTELKRHLAIVQAYEWHALAAQREQATMRASLAALPPDTCYFQADFSENIGVPLGHEESSDMWHGAARKTLSVFGVFLRQWVGGEVKTRNILYVSDVIEKTHSIRD